MPKLFSSAVPQEKDALRTRTQLYLAVGVALLVGLLVASYMQTSAGLDALRQFGVTNQRADRLDRLNQLLVEAQSSVRGYALTRDPAYHDAFRATIPRIHESLDVIRREQSDPRHAAAADLLIKSAQTLAARTEMTARHIENGDAPEKNWFDQGTVAMDAYRLQHNAMKVRLFTENLENVKRSMSGFEAGRITGVTLAVASLLLLVLVVSQEQRKQELQEKIRHLLEEENERLEAEVRRRTAELTQLATYLTDVRETEKMHLARELHDELGALLTAAKLDADRIERLLPPESQALVTDRIARLRQSLIGGITLQRRIINDLRPALLHDLGLIEALKALIEEFRQQEEIEVDADLEEIESTLPADVSLSLFRIVQEALTNIRKYARARRVRVSLSTTPRTIELEIKDDGIGFDLASPKLARHGLAGIKHRVFTHGGRLDLRTAPGSGVTIRVVLPA
ncbi:MAG: CHASE3 domain-containing protein [Betaproteobacteria bacterium]|nr:CHASE3 domain-containing protein [Betaproteobacteria bacterium]